jgi:hypothetical protein
MKQILSFIFALLLTNNVWAADNTVVVTPGTGLTLRSKDVGAGVQSLMPVLGDSSGNVLATAPGTPNAVFALPIQGVTGGTAVPITGTITGTVTVNGSGVTNPVSVAAGQIVGGGIVDLGAQADSACSTDTATCSLIALIKRNNQDTSAPANLAASATGGCTGGTLLTAASNNATVIGTAAAHTLCWLRWENTTTSLVDIRLYDTATTPSGGAPCNSATNVTSNDVVQSNATSPGGVSNLGPFGQAFASGIVLCVTGANANNDNTNAVTGINVSYGFK